MSDFVPHEWENDGSNLVYDGDDPIAYVHEGKYTHLIATAPELYWMAYNLYEPKRGNGLNPEYVKQVIPQREELLKRIQRADKELKPCPFCGGTVMRVKSTWNTYYFVACASCKGRGSVEETEAEAIAAWNRRASNG